MVTPHQLGEDAVGNPVGYAVYTKGRQFGTSRHNDVMVFTVIMIVLLLTLTIYDSHLYLVYSAFALHSAKNVELPECGFDTEENMCLMILSKLLQGL